MIPAHWRCLGVAPAALCVAIAPAALAAPKKQSNPARSRPPARARQRQARQHLPYRHVEKVPAAASRRVLEWRGILWGTERVTLDGLPLQPVRHYTLEHDRGILLLQPGLPAGKMLQVSYRIESPFSEPNPLLLRPRVVGVPTPGPRRPRFVGLALGTGTAPLPRFTGLAPSAAGPEPGEVVSGGLRLVELREQLQEGEGRGAAYTYFRADAFDPAARAEDREEFTSQLQLQPGANRRLAISNSISRGSILDPDYQEQEQHRLQLEQRWGRAATSLLMESRSSRGYGVENALNSISLSVNSPLSGSLAAEGVLAMEDTLAGGRTTQGQVMLRQALGRGAEAQASLQHRSTLFSGNILETGLRLFAQPADGTDVSVSLRQAQSERDGTYQKLSGEVTAALSSAVQLTAQGSRQTSDRMGDLLSYGLGMAARPTTAAMLEAAFSQSIGDDTGEEALRTLRLSLDPTAVVKLQLGYDLLTSTRSGESQNANWAVTVGDRRYVKLEGQSGTTTPLDADRYADSIYRVEVRPGQPFAVSGSYRRVAGELDDHGLATLGAQLQLVRGLDFSAAYRRPTTPEGWAPDLYGQDFRVSLSPVQGFKVFGAYSDRPESTVGDLLDQVNRTVGVESRLGSFSLQGSVTRVDQPLDEDPDQRLDLLATLSLRRGTRVYGGLRTQDGVLAEGVRSRLYRIGMAQNLGTSFFLMLEGQFGWLRDPRGTQTWNPEDAQGQARVGFRF